MEYLRVFGPKVKKHLKCAFSRMKILFGFFNANPFSTDFFDALKFLYPHIALSTQKPERKSFSLSAVRTKFKNIYGKDGSFICLEWKNIYVNEDIVFKNRSFYHLIMKSFGRNRAF